mmetsp:Transcript_23117/g.35671  ORF Transcript_23117/g.35671 Transcript_23117/m.35671 type:complete len:297 (+) Transcript_23117:117-1007(+)
MGNTAINSILFQPPDSPYDLPKDANLVWLETRHGNSIPAILLRPKRHSNRSKMTLIYSHANSEDLGLLYPKLKELSTTLGVNIFAYDYTGYGYSKKLSPSMEPSEDACYADIEAAYKYLINNGTPSERIVLYGRSVGTGPSCHLASLIGPRLGGLILHSPFTSVYRIMIDFGCSMGLFGDMFQNLEAVEKIKCPVFIIHGVEDEIIPFSHGCTLYNAFSTEVKYDPLWVEGMGHNSMSRPMADSIISRIAGFLKHVDKRSNVVRKNKSRIRGVGYKNKAKVHSIMDGDRKDQYYAI